MAQSDTGNFSRDTNGKVIHSYYRWRTVELDKEWQETQKDIEELENLPQVKTEPDQETLALWNEQAEQEQKRKPDILQRLKDKRYWAKIMEEQGVLTNEEEERLIFLEQTIKEHE